MDLTLGPALLTVSWCRKLALEIEVESSKSGILNNAIKKLMRITPSQLQYLKTF